MRIAITGVPGTGKTTIARLLAKKLGFKYIDLNKLLVEKFKPKYNDFYDSYEVDDEMLKEVSRYLPDNAIIDSHLSHLLDNIDFIILLKTDPNVLKERLEKRGYSFRKIFENIWAQNMGIIDSELSGKYVTIDTTNRSPEEIVEEIVSTLKRLGFIK